ncbi:MAG: succinyl-diaminopimelate desuccinylase [Halocynthiibacter sp.]
MSHPIDPQALTAALIQCPSVTPIEGGALILLEKILTEAGFDCTRVDRNGTPNLFARWGQKNHAKTFGFNGHTDVVPLGDENAWTMPPFGAEIKDGFMYGRGATDMKSGVAAFVAAAIDFVTETPPDGSLIITITGDEEGDATDGTIALLDWMDDKNEQMSVCLVGEPTCPDEMGDMIKIGRRGSMTTFLTAKGEQGHAAYPHRANNPIPAMVTLLDVFARHELDTGTDHFDPSTLAITTFDVGNPATNVIPAACKATMNIRFNDAHHADDLIAWIKDEMQKVEAATGVTFTAEFKVSGDSFITPPGPFSELISQAVQAETNRIPELSTSGGTSDARFVKNHCPVVECGLVGKTMHQVDERVEVTQIHRLKAIYTRCLRAYFDL